MPLQSYLCEGSHNTRPKADRNTVDRVLPGLHSACGICRKIAPMAARSAQRLRPARLSVGQAHFGAHRTEQVSPRFENGPAWRKGLSVENREGSGSKERWALFDFAEISAHVLCRGGARLFSLSRQSARCRPTSFPRSELVVTVIWQYTGLSTLETEQRISTTASTDQRQCQRRQKHGSSDPGRSVGPENLLSA